MAIVDAGAQPVKEPRQARRHPLIVTIARVADHQETYAEHLTPYEQGRLVELAETLDRVHRRVTGEPA